MKFLTYSQDRKLGSYYKYLLETTFACDVRLMEGQQIFFDELSNIVNYDFVFYLSEEKLSDSNALKLENHAGKTPSVYVCKEKEMSLKFSKFFANERIAVLDSTLDTQDLLRKIAKILDIVYQPNESTSNFIPFSLDYLPRIANANCDFFIKLSDEKYLKILKKGSEINSDDIVRIQKNNIQCLYLRTHDFENFLDSVDGGETNYTELPATEIPQAVVSDLTFSHDIFYHLSSKFGLNERAMTYANKSIETLYSFFDLDENLGAVWKNLMKKKNFLTEHSLMVAYLSNAILSHTSYRSDNNSLKLSIAAILHDIEIKDDKFFNLEFNEHNDDNFSQREVNAFKAHVFAGVELLKKFKEIPADIDKILIHHHEKYDGSGYPRGLGGSKIPIFACVFIVAHELILHMLKNDYSEQELVSFIEKKKEEYKDGFFQEVIIALEKIR